MIIHYSLTIYFLNYIIYLMISTGYIFELPIVMEFIEIHIYTDNNLHIFFNLENFITSILE